MKKYVLLAVAALVGLAVVSCKQKEIEPEDALSIAGTTITVGKEAASPAITFTANKAWKAESDSQWIALDKTSGEAGNVTITIAVSENDTWAERSGKVTVSVGKVKTVFTIVQGTESILESAFAFSISPEAQDIAIPVKTNLQYTVTPAADSPWITVVSTKAAPQEGTIKVHVAANTELAPRTGSFVVAAPGYSQTYTVVQSAAWIPASAAEAIYIGNSQSIYDNETWTINLHQQYVVKLATEDGDKVTVVLNKKGELKDGVFSFFPVDKLPQGSFEVDATGKKVDGTFSIMSSTGEEKYYTGLEIDGRELTIYDGEVVVAEENGNYIITAILVDAVGTQHNYSYAGPVALSNDFCGGNAEVNWKNTYDTHFTTKANGWYVSFYHPRKNPADKNEVAYSSFSFFSAPGDVNLEEIPEGTYTFGAAEADASLKYKNGILKANPGLLSDVNVSLYNEAGGIVYTDVTPEGSKLVITKNADGTKNFKYSATVTPYSYDESYNKVSGSPVQVSIDVNVPVGKATDTQTHPSEDGDAVITSLEGAAGSVYIGYWYGSNIGVLEDGTTMKPAIADTPCNVFSIGSNSSFNGAWSAFFSIVSDAGWTYVKTYPANNPRYSSDPVPDGTYTFSSEAKIGALLPLRSGSASRCYIQNTYSGTTYYPVSGSITLDKGTISMDLVCKATEAALEGRPSSPASIHVTGGSAFTCSYLQDWSAVTRVKGLSINSPVPLN